jgi:hypothetical protein
MTFEVWAGVPRIDNLFALWEIGDENGTLSTSGRILYRKVLKVIQFLETNPFHNSLHSHEIEPLSRKFGSKVFQSYLENNKPAAGRLYWAYGPKKGQITIIGLEPHPEDKKSRGYETVRLDSFPA